MSVISRRILSTPVSRLTNTACINQSINRLSQQTASFATLPPQKRVAKPKDKKFFRFRGAYYAEPQKKRTIAQPQFDHVPGFIQRVDNKLPEGKQYYFDLNAYPRSKDGKCISKHLRKERNHIPAVIFDRQNPRGNTVNLSLEREEVEDFIRTWQEPCAMTRVGAITILHDSTASPSDTQSTAQSTKLSETRAPIPVMVGEINRHPVTQEILNITFITFKPTDKVKLDIPVGYINEAESLGYRRGALLLHLRHHIQVYHQGPHTSIPSRFILNLMDIDLGQIVRATDLRSKLPKTVKLVKPLEEWILINMQNIGSRRWVEEEEEATQAAAATPAKK